MNKDVIYIDTEDDITAIIGKIKASKERIVALVPPKRIGILQSAVNLRLLARMAETSNKHLVLVTTNKALIALSAVAMIPISKNLQSKPELIEVDEIESDDGEDVIDGAQLPIGELQKTADSLPVDDVDAAISTINIEKEEEPIKVQISKSGVKVPDFAKFRKKLFLGITGIILLTIFLVWANIYAPYARVIITAKTSSAPVSLTVKLGGATATDVTKNTIQSLSKQIQKEVSVNFSGTGTKDLGTKATGTITISKKNIDLPATIPASTKVTSGGKTFITQSKIDIVDQTGKYNGSETGVGNGSVIAEANGEDYNLASGAKFTVGTYTSVSGVGSAMTGGTSNIINIVTADDVQKASQVLVDLSTDTVKQQLVNEFTNGEFVIADSFNVTRADPISVPAIGEEVTTSAKLTSQTTFTMAGIAKSELQAYLKDAVGKQITDKNNQRIYSDGIEDAVLSGFLKTDEASTVNISTVGKIGPNINESSIKNQVKGKKFGDVQLSLEGIKGVISIDVKFSYFWVSRVPNDSNKINVEFILQDV